MIIKSVLKCSTIFITFKILAFVSTVSVLQLFTSLKNIRQSSRKIQAGLQETLDVVSIDIFKKIRKFLIKADLTRFTKTL